MHQGSPYEFYDMEDRDEMIFDDLSIRLIFDSRSSNGFL
jgi:hypothetical protein